MENVDEAMAPWKYEDNKELRFEKLSARAEIPSRGSKEAAGLDLCALDQCRVYKGCITIVHTGLAVAIPRGYFGAVCSRSGNTIKLGLVVANQPGIIDSDYRGEIMVVLTSLFEGFVNIEPGQRIAQLIIQPYSNICPVEVNELDETIRGDKGLGSTGQ
jgi:dUTP pyrophosphatase